jgi:hypothetical protein
MTGARAARPNLSTLEARRAFTPRAAVDTEVTRCPAMRS